MKNNKGFTIIEIIVSLVLSTIILSIAVNTYQGYISDSREDKRENIIKIYGIVLEDIINNTGNIPSGYCTSDGGATYDDTSCYDGNGCSENICDVNNNFCSNGNNGSYFDLIKLINDTNYFIDNNYLLDNEHYPSGFNYKICKLGASDIAYSVNLPIKETGVTANEENFINPSFIFKKLNNENGINKILYKYINYF